MGLCIPSVLVIDCTISKQKRDHFVFYKDKIMKELATLYYIAYKNQGSFRVDYNCNSVRQAKKEYP